MDDAITQLLALAQNIGVAGLLLLALYGLHRGWWVPGSVYRERLTELAAERERSRRWMEVAASNLELAEKAVGKVASGDQ